MITESAAYAVLNVVKSTMTYLYESGLWVGRQSNMDYEHPDTAKYQQTNIESGMYQNGNTAKWS